MQKHLSLLQDARGCMTQFDPLTPEIVAAQSEDGLTYEELKQVLVECGIDIEKVIFDGTRTFQDASRAVKLYRIAKDMDGLDRVRFNGLDFRYLRTPYARRLPLVAGGLLEEPLLECIKESMAEAREVPQ